ncbi:5'-AMP-activated protein kinase subunit beta-1-like [Portunus trituberculatus]|uniref:5'-AMP-activated protein kinase subunit beta-1-like n=1 Tax=Portunus trituberculatus TaxID=210409 RepID=UPI001E1CFA39|nr:5'-AMP-activated protein kinase subunit beta-1-like [Portunus trituberculatus]
MGNHSSQDRRDRSKGTDLGHYGTGRGTEGPFTLHQRTTNTSITKPSTQQAANHSPHHTLQQDKEGDDTPPPRVRPIIPAGNKKILPVVIKWTGGGTNVAIAGTFNHWQKIPMVKSEKDFVAIVDLPEGSHEYRFMVDGEWKVSKNDNTTTNTANNNNANINNNNNKNNNNVITISETDFEEFETALLPDPNDKGDDKKSHGSAGSRDRAGSEEDEFGQDIPEYQQTDKIRGPPVLPPHLLQVILNKDTPISCEPTLLPEPNHVMLNHMYALSIRDGMMVLSTSNRYKKKCVTTLIYRPIE